MAEHPFKIGPPLNIVNVSWPGGLILVVEIELDGLTLVGNEPVNFPPINFVSFNTDTIDLIEDVFREQIKISKEDGPAPPIKETITTEMRGYYNAWSYEHYKKTDTDVETITAKLFGFTDVFMNILRGDNWREDLANSSLFPGARDAMLRINGACKSNGNFEMDFPTFFRLALYIISKHGSSRDAYLAASSRCSEFWEEHTQFSTTYEWRAQIFFNLSKIKAKHKAKTEKKLEEFEFEIEIENANEYSELLFGLKASLYKGLKEFPVTDENEEINWDDKYLEDDVEEMVTSNGLKLKVNLTDLAITVTHN